MQEPDLRCSFRILTELRGFFKTAVKAILIIVLRMGTFNGKGIQFIVAGLFLLVAPPSVSLALFFL